MRTREWLKQKRLESGLSQWSLAEKVGLSPFAIIQIEQGRRKGSNDTWTAIENYFATPHKLDKKIKKEIAKIDDKEIMISYNSDELIDELLEDIQEFGPHHKCVLFYKEIDSHLVFTNYDFLVEELPFDPKKELEKDEKYLETTLGYALDVFTAQNKIIK